MRQVTMYAVLQHFVMRNSNRGHYSMVYARVGLGCGVGGCIAGLQIPIITPAFYVCIFCALCFVMCVLVGNYLYIESK